MTRSEEVPEDFSEEISQVAEEYFQCRKNGTAGSIDSTIEVYPHLGIGLRESLEAIDLLLPASTRHVPESLGDFRIDQELGRGGIGIVYSATQTSLQRKVALKVLNLTHGEAIAVEQFQREAQTVAALSHAHIVQSYAVGEVDGLQYFAMQLIEGDSVAQLITKQRGTTSSRKDERARRFEIARWGAQIAEAVEYAHKQGIVHRDIKPSNILVDRDQRIWLTDFGLARHESDMSARMASGYQGTPNYMSPEQASAIDATVDHRTDIYSLGVTLVEWLTGQSVVDGSNPVESLSRLQQNCIEQPHILLRGYSRDWIAVLEKCTARDPNARYQTAAELAVDLRAIADHRPVAARPQSTSVRVFRTLISQKTFVKTVVLSAVATMATIGIGSIAWRAYSNTRMIPVIFASDSGDWLSVTAQDNSGNQIAKFTTADGLVLLPREKIHLDVVASQRLGYKRKIDPVPTTRFENVKTIQLEDPQSHCWILDDVLWFLNCNFTRNGKSASQCIALRSDGIQLLEADSGKILWTFQDPDHIDWGNSVRGCPSTFQPDRCALMEDTNGNDSDEIVFAHPDKPELLCLDGETGQQLWRSNLLESAGIQTPNAGSFCPIVLQEFADANGALSLAVVVACHAPALSKTERWLLSVDPATGKVRWNVARQQMPYATLPVSTWPLHVQWGEIEKRPSEFDRHESMQSYVDEYWRHYSQSMSSVFFETNLRLGAERPFSLSGRGNENWHWIEGREWLVIDPQTGELVKSWKLPDDCLCPLKLIRTVEGKTLVLTVHLAMNNETDFVAWDVETQSPVWEKSIQCDLNRLPQSYLSRQQDFPIVVDLDSDGVDEWIAASHAHGMTPPYGMATAYRGDNANAIWEEPFHLPNLDQMIERGVAVSDIDGDGWKDLLLGSRFKGGGVRADMGCFIDLISGKTGERIWYSQVRTESSSPIFGTNELVDFTVLEDQGLIAVVTYSGITAGELESARPYSTTFLNLFNGGEESFGLGLLANSFNNNTWLEHRLPPPGPFDRTNLLQRSKLVGWAYPVSRSDTTENATLWSTEDYEPQHFADVDRDGFPEVIGSKKSSVGYREYALLNGLTGIKSWSKSIDTQSQTIGSS